MNKNSNVQNKNICQRNLTETEKLNLIEKIPIDEGKEVLVLLLTEQESEIDLNFLLAQQESLRKIWVNEENLYGEI